MSLNLNLQISITYPAIKPSTLVENTPERQQINDDKKIFLKKPAAVVIEGYKTASDYGS